MKKPKNKDSMLSTESTQSRSLHKSDSIHNVVLAIVCGYTISGEFGYFVCNEEVLVDEKTGLTTYKYTNQREFVKKLNERTYPVLLGRFKDLVETLKKQ